MDKENQAPGSEEAFRLGKSILKSNGNHTVPLPLIPLKDEISRTAERRRVSFAPEVTLHKIDFVPQYESKARRRETIAFIPSQVSDLSEEGSQLSQNGYDGPEVGREVLHDSSDEEEMEVNVETEKHEVGAEHTGDNEEQTMEFTGQIPQVPVFEPAAPTPHLPVLIELIPPWEDMPMEFTGQFLVPQFEFPMEAPQEAAFTDERIEMEFTEVVSSIAREEYQANSMKAEVAETKEVNRAAGQSPNLSPAKSIADGEMELTQSVGRITLGQAEMPESQPSNNSQPAVVEESESQEPMKLTQTDEKIEVVENLEPVDAPVTEEAADLSKKRQLPSVSPPSKRSHPLSYTTTIPLADVSVDSIYDDEDYELVSLTHFMKDIGIRFYDDLDIGTSSIKRISISLPKVTDGSTSYTIQDYVNANNQLPILEQLSFSCEEMRKNIQDGKKLFEQFDSATLTSNPKLFKQYYHSPLEKQLGMQSEFQLIKSYCRKQAMEAWYTWRTTMIRNLLELTQLKYEQIQENEHQLKAELTAADKSYLESKEQLHRLKLILAQLSDMNDSQTEENKQRLLSFRNELVEVFSKVKACRQIITQLQESAQANANTIAENEAKIDELRAQLVQSESELNKNKTYETFEIATLEKKFKLLQCLSHLEYDRIVNGGLKFTYKRSLSVLVKSEGIDVALVSTDSFFNNQLAELFATHLKQNVNSLSDMSIVHRRWLALKNLDTDVYKLSLRFPIELGEDADSCTIKMRYFNSIRRRKAIIRISVAKTALADYPQLAKIMVLNGTQDTSEVLREAANDCLDNELLMRGADIASH